MWRNRHAPGGQAKYNAQANRCRKLTKRYQRLKEQRLLRHGSVSAFYRYVNKRLRSGHSIVLLHAIDGSLLTDDSSKSQAFNNYFISVFTRPTPYSNIETSFTLSITSNNIVFTPSIYSL